MSSPEVVDHYKLAKKTRPQEIEGKKIDNATELKIPRQKKGRIAELSCAHKAAGNWKIFGRSREEEETGTRIERTYHIVWSAENIWCGKGEALT